MFSVFIYLFVYLQCNQEGHISRDCPNAPAGGGGNRACHWVSPVFLPVEVVLAGGHASRSGVAAQPSLARKKEKALAQKKVPQVCTLQCPTYNNINSVSDNLALHFESCVMLLYCILRTYNKRLLQTQEYFKSCIFSLPLLAYSERRH